MRERMCVCGLGKVGRPILDTFRMKGFQAIGYDINPALTEAELSDAVEGSDAAVFIVPTPSNPNGSFSNLMLRDAIVAFHRRTILTGRKDYLYIVTSTTTPRSCDEFRQTIGDNLVYKPEYIRLEFVRGDLLCPPLILIGEASKAAGDRAEAIYKAVVDVPVFRMTLLEAELAKITLNCALTMKISLANQLHLVATKMGANAERIMEAVGADPRIGKQYLFPGRPFAGPCLPRDNKNFRYVAAREGIDACLSWAADRINETMGYHAEE